MSKNKKFKRQCVFCKTIKSKEDLIRITKDHLTGVLKINNDSKTLGRSVYICKNHDCIENTFRKKRIEYYLKSDISTELQQEIKNFI